MMKIEADSVISVPPKDIWDVMFDPDFMAQVAHSLVRQSLDTFSQKMEMSKQEMNGPTSSRKSVPQPAPQTNPGIIKMVLNSIWEVTLKKLLRLFGVKR